jgi:hypothetical protein
LEDGAIALWRRPSACPQPNRPPTWSGPSKRKRRGLFLGVNFHGLDPWGENQSQLEAAGVAVAVWAWTTPSTRLAGQKTLPGNACPFRHRRLVIIEPLRSLVADARHLPLAVSPNFHQRRGPRVRQAAT